MTELETNNPNYKLASYYYDKCIELNTRFKGTLFNWGELLHQKGICLNYIKDIEANKFLLLLLSGILNRRNILMRLKI